MKATSLLKLLVVFTISTILLQQNISLKNESGKNQKLIPFCISLITSTTIEHQDFTTTEDESLKKEKESNELEDNELEDDEIEDEDVFSHNSETLYHYSIPVEIKISISEHTKLQHLYPHITFSIPTPPPEARA